MQATPLCAVFLLALTAAACDYDASQLRRPGTSASATSTATQTSWPEDTATLTSTSTQSTSASDTSTASLSSTSTATDSPAATATATATASTSELRALFTFDESSGTSANDGSGRGNQAKVNGTWVSGVSGFAVRDSGAYGGAVLVTHSPSLVLDGSNYSFEAWIKPRAVSAGWGSGSAWRWIFDKAVYMGAFDYGFYVSGSPATKVCFTVVANTAGFCANYAFKDETWTHVALTSDAGTWRLYVNGTVVGTQGGHGAPLPSSTADLYLGLAATLDLDNVQIWARTRTPAEICADAGKTLSGFTCS